MLSNGAENSSTAYRVSNSTNRACVRVFVIAPVNILYSRADQTMALVPKLSLAILRWHYANTLLMSTCSSNANLENKLIELNVKKFDVEIDYLSGTTCIGCKNSLSLLG